MNEIREILFVDDKIYTGTDGGFFIFDKSKNDYKIINNTSGLSYNDVRDMTFDEEGKIWIGLGNGFIDIYDVETEKWNTIVIDVQNFNINDLAINGNEVYFATDFGISQYIIDKKEVKATFRKLGVFDRNTAVKKILISDDDIWAGTDIGIAKSNLKYPNLQDPQFWENFTKDNDLPDNRINGFITFENKIYVATQKGTAYFDSLGFVKVVDGITDRVADFTVFENKLYAGAFSGVYLLNEEKKWILFGKNLWDISVVRFNKDGVLWAGTKLDGLFSYNVTSGEWEKRMPSVPAGNYFADIDIDMDGVVWAVSGQFRNKGIYSFNGKKWGNFDRDDGISSNLVISVKTDKKNIKWFGTPGYGAFTIEGDDYKITKYDTTDGRLAGSDTPSFVIVDDIGIDEDGNVWLLNRYANNGKSIVTVTPDFEWNYFSTLDGLNSVEVSAITFDKSGKVWIGTAGVSPRGLNVLDYKGTIEDKSDDIWEYYTTADGLESNEINTLAVDNSGYIWIGTPEGTNYWDGEMFRTAYGLINDYVNCIAVDPFDNKWFGTKGGISVLDRYNYKWKHYNQHNSGLVDNAVLSIAINELTGDIYIGTERGLSKAKTTFSKPDESILELSVFPNPFIPGEGGSHLVIGDLTIESSVKIYSASGRLIKELNEESGELYGSKAFWNGRDSDGNPAPSGIYILVAYTEDGKIKRGKVALIRK